MAMPVIVIVLLLPMFLLAKVATAALWSSVTESFVSTPTRAAEVFTSCAVAFADALYTRSLAVIPETMSSLTVMFAVVEG